MEPPRCFISYSWDSEQHQEWVQKLTVRMRENGIDAILDQFHCKPGTDLEKFMETSVRESKFVLLVCTPNFAQKADAGRGGVEYEKTILTGEIFTGEVDETKFVPLLRDGDAKESLPSYLKSRLFIDFRDDSLFETKLEELLRHFHDEPLYNPPPIGPKPDWTKPKESTEADSVLLGASSPYSVRPGEEFTARFAAYVKEMEHQVRKTLQDLSPRSETQLGVKECRWKTGTLVTVVLSGRHLKINEAEQDIEWNGRFNLVEFDVSVSENAPKETIVLKYDVYVDEILLAKLRIDLRVSFTYKSKQQVIKQTEPAQSAFASYSSQDRARVLDRVAAVRTSTGLDVFMDCLDLHPGEKWKDKLQSEILNRELFMLFWSKHAMKSKWVEWEWTTAYELKGVESFQLHPLETISEAPPPEKLAELHFSDSLMFIRQGYQKSPNA